MNTKSVLYILLVVLVGLALIFTVSVFDRGEVQPTNGSDVNSVDSSPGITNIDVSLVEGGDVAEVTWQVIPHENDLLTWALVYTDENNSDHFMDSALYGVSCAEACEEEQIFTSRINIDYEGDSTLFVRAYLETQEGEVLAESVPVTLE